MYKLATYLLAALLLAACTPKQPAGENTLYVSIPPLRSIVEGIVGNDFKIEVLVPPGASPETFEPTPRQFVALNRAQLIFNVGLIDFETSLLGKVGDQAKVVDLSRGIELIAGSCSHAHHGAGQEHARGVDPHVWTSPKALQTMAANAYKAIRSAYPDSVQYEAGYNRLQKTLQELDTRTAEKIARSGVKSFIVYHPALTYYARDYGLRQVAIEADGKDPSAKQLTAIIRQAREEGVRRIFYQNQFPASTVETIARDIDAECVEIDPLDEDTIGAIDAMTDLITTK
ncbi:zinc ABC transporter substrate-binding protein [Alistipes sp.]|uniref:metal ABC transporter solute-binding protein, Zn/Mn family n=1 Tax=Alistipes sp. TaxID=1872444 RepID=UPI0025BEE436|nr:zinc ABC transporter substrate-binding protein [Alistipes sp.]